MVTNKDIDNAKIPFDDEITEQFEALEQQATLTRKRKHQQQEWRSDEWKANHLRQLLATMPLEDARWVQAQVDIFLSEQEIQQQVKWPDPSLHTTPSPGRNISHADEIPDVLSRGQMENFMDELGELMARDIEYGSIQEKDVSPLSNPQRFTNPTRKKKRTRKRH